MLLLVSVISSKSFYYTNNDEKKHGSMYFNLKETFFAALTEMLCGFDLISSILLFLFFLFMITSQKRVQTVQRSTVSL